MKTASKVAGEIRASMPTPVMPKKDVRRNDRYVHYAWAAVAEALRDAGLENTITTRRSPADRLHLGSGIGGITP